MSKYRRNREGSTYFFTVVTHLRQRILTTELGRSSLRRAFASVRAEHPFGVIAIVLLPDHLHAIWELPAGDSDFSDRWRRIKAGFTRQWRAGGGQIAATSASRASRGEHGVWQRRFFEHTCRDERDLKRCVDYVHVNPLKHRLVERLADWRWSSFHRYVRLGEYPPDWGSATAWHGDEFRGFE